MAIDVVYAMGSEHVPLPSGAIAVVQKGQHWPASDQVVTARPQLFTADPRYGLMYSQAPPGYDADLNELEPAVEDASLDPDDEAATAAPGERRSVRRPRS